ncbi:MAG: hypothetical protein ACRCZF_01575 [Gemmataceae bacterium]
MDPIPDRVRPILRKAVLCERVETDREGRVYAFVPVHTIRMPADQPRDYVPPTLQVYLQLQEARGPFLLKISLCKQGTDANLYPNKALSVDFDGSKYQFMPLELKLDLRGLKIPKPGSYELRVWANHLDLHQTSYAAGWNEPPMFLEVLESVGTDSGGVL